MKRKNNAMFRPWYAIAFITIVLFISKFIWLKEMDAFIFSWLIILLTGLIYQLTIPTKYTERMTHIIFIIFIIVITIFVSYLMEKYITIDSEGWWIFSGDWWNHLLLTLLESLTLMILKISLWFFLKLNHKAVDRLLNDKEDALEEVQTLREENASLKAKITELTSKEEVHVFKNEIKKDDKKEIKKDNKKLPTEK